MKTKDKLEIILKNKPYKKFADPNLEPCMFYISNDNRAFIIFNSDVALFVDFNSVIESFDISFQEIDKTRLQAIIEA